jgi:hypothetical protein
MTSEFRDRLTAAGRVAAGMLIFVLFLLVLMVSIAQQSIMSRMSGTAYSSAYAIVREVEQRQAQLPSLAQSEAALNERVVRSQADLRGREADYHSAWGEFAPLLRRISQWSPCDIIFAEPALDSPGPRLDAWRQAAQCARDNRLPPSLAQQFRALAAMERSFPVAHRRALAAGADHDQAQERLAAVRQRIQAASTLGAEEREAVKAFHEIDALRRTGLPTGDLLVSLPPALVQLLLSGIAGAFGALLITLILIVYPGNSLQITSSAGYGPRVLLGALIAVGVYVILLAGTAVLGTGSEFDAAGANYMTFCAISILAGMFSDRVAHWLSGRANIFFGNDAGANP